MLPPAADPNGCLVTQTIQALSNPHYLLQLSNTGYLDSEPFLNFVTYLEYWEKPQYAKYLMFVLSGSSLGTLACPSLRKVTTDLALWSRRVRSLTGDLSPLRRRLQLSASPPSPPPAPPPSLPPSTPYLGTGARSKTRGRPVRTLEKLVRDPVPSLLTYQATTSRAYHPASSLAFLS